MVIRARVFNDLIRNGLAFGRRNALDPWMNAWEISVALSPTQTVVSGLTSATTISGTYEARFINLRSGNYTVCATLPDGWANSEPSSLNIDYGKPCKSVNLVPAQSAYLLFGVYQPVVTASELLPTDEVITDADQVIDLPVDLAEEESLGDDEATANRQLFLPLIAR